MTRINLDDLPWVEPASGVRFKVAFQDGRRVRFVEFSAGFSEADWCCLGHIGYVIAGRLEIIFADRVEELSAGNVLMINAGERDKHRARVIDGTVRLFLVEDV